MEAEVLSRRENDLLGRVEVKFQIDHQGEPTPTRDAVREELSKVLKAPKERVVLDHLRSDFGRSVSVGEAKVYETVEAAKDVEPEHMLVRNRLLVPEKKAAPKAPPPEEE